MANAFHYSIGRKFIQAVSGAFLFIFLLLHGTINFFSVIDTFTGKFGAIDGLFQKGCDFMALPIVDIMVPVLALGFLVHIGYGCYLTWYNVKARGGYKRYEVASKAKTDSWSANNMFVLGIVILGLLFFHLTHFWAKMQLQEFTGGIASNPYDLPDHRLEQPDLDEEAESHRSYRSNFDFAPVRCSRNQRIPASKRTDLKKDTDRFPRPASKTRDRPFL